MEAALKHRRELMRQGFEQMDKRFEQVDKRFAQVDDRCEEMIRRHHRHFLWLIAFITSVGALIIAAGKFW